MTEQENEFPRKGSSHHGTEVAWSVEARSGIKCPIACGELLLGSEWVQVPFSRAPGGVPSGGLFFQGADLGLLTFAAAQALRWWFLADLRASYKDIGVETRIVRYEVKFSKECTAVAAGEFADSRSENNVPREAIAKAQPVTTQPKGEA